MRCTRLTGWIFGITLTLGLTAPATAAWMRAETAHFVVYSDDSESDVRRMAVELETFDAVLRRFHQAPEQDGAGSNKLTVYVLDDIAAVQRLCGCGYAAGFYVGRASGSVAFTPRNDYAAGKGDLTARTILQHEYAHHFLFGNFALAYPAWFSEGYAEFASTYRRDKSGLTIGAPANHRAYGLFSGARLSVTAMFDPAGRKLTPEQRELLYGRGWLLTHYILLNQQRRAQFGKYLAAINSGTPSLTAARDAFGDLKQLDRDLDKYLRAKTISAVVMPPSAIPEQTATLRALSAGEAALIEQRIVSVRGVNTKTAGPLFAKARPIAARYPGNAVVQGWFAEMAFDADDLPAAAAAADRAIAADPKSVQGLLYKGLIGVRRAALDKGDAAAWRTARSYIIRANQLDNDNAQPLLSFYQSYAVEGREPTKNAVAGLIRAQELAPQDNDLRALAVVQSVRDGELARARRLLEPLAYDPHRGADNEAAKLLAVLRESKDKAAAQAALDSFIKPKDESAGTKAPAQ